jgi:hypothetical protein
MRVQLASLVLMLAAACDRSPAAQQAVRVLVVRGEGVQGACAQVEATGDGRRQASGPIPLDGREGPYRVAVYRGELPARVVLRAVAYADMGCSVPTSPPVQSAELEVAFAQTVSEVTLTLEPGRAEVDADGDGSAAGVDCDDADAARSPDRAEACSGGQDEDCDAQVDCADEGCDGQGCGPSSAGLCREGGCREVLCSDGQDDDGDGAADCVDADCVGKGCGQGGTCAPGRCLAASELGLCTDGEDNDGDGAVDCADLDCPEGSPCSDGLGCTTGDACAAGGVCGGAAVTCPPYDAAACYGPVGSCEEPSGTCSYVPRAGACDDGRACSVGDSCDGDGGCVGTPRACDPPPGQCLAAGVCQESLDGGCTYAPLPLGVFCDDGDNCTVDDECTADGGCGGTPVTCVAPSECFAVGPGCDDDGGCRISARTGEGCDGGTCAPDGGCVPQRWVNYVPSNFSPWQLPASGGAVVFNCGVTEFRGEPDGGFTWTNFCGSAPPPEPASVDLAGVNGLLLHVDSLVVANGSALSLRGSWPVILAVKGSATVAGTLDVGSQYGGRLGAGSNQGCTAANMGAAGVLGGSPASSGGGGGGGFAGAGGRGGAGSSNGGAGGAKGEVRGNDTLVPLRGGCRGGDGGGAVAASDAGTAGRAGGAFQLSVDGPLVLEATSVVTAYGEGGRGGPADALIGGGGAGSGGGLLLEATTLTQSGWVTANGGSGGEGSGYNGWNGAHGSAGLAQSVSSAGYAVGSCGGDGAPGGARYVGAQAGTDAQCALPSKMTGGGGGGGGAGRIRFNASSSCALNATWRLSPAPTGNRASCRP